VADTPLRVQISLVRPDDLLNLEITAVNLRLDVREGERSALVVDDPAQAALLIVRFPPQTIFEEAYFEQPAQEPSEQKLGSDEIPHKSAPPDPGLPKPGAPGEAQHRLGSQTRLVFRVPADAQIPYTVAGLLDWSTFDLIVAPVADVAAGASPPPEALTIRAPLDDETTLQLPVRLHLSPTHEAAWDHSPAVVAHAGRAELWHTRLVGLDAQGEPRAVDDEHPIGLRAIWSPDYQESGPVPPPTDSGMPGAITPMNVADRHQIVVLTSAFEGWAETAFGKFVPMPVDASMVMLSALGGWLRSTGKWNPPARIKPPRRRIVHIDDFFRGELLRRAVPNGAPDAVLPPEMLQAVAPDLAGRLAEPIVGRVIDEPIIRFPIYDIDEDARLDLSQWCHIAAQGRDHYVRIVYEGKLSDLGHRASLVKVTERRFENSPAGDPVAYLRQYMYIVVREPEKVYANEGLANGGRAMPFTRIRLTTLVTPHIDYPYEIAGSNPPYVPPGKIAGSDRSFWVTVGSRDFLFHGIAEDVAGNIVDFAKPLIFVPNSEANFGSLQAAIIAPAGRTRLQGSIPGQKVTFAPRDPTDTKDNTSFVTASFMLGNEGASRETFFKPALFKADVRIPAVEALTGTSNATSIRLAAHYVTNGFGHPDNKTDAFAEVGTYNPATGALDVATGSNAKFDASQAGGFATPQLDVKALSRAVGPLGSDIAAAQANSFDPATVFAGAGAQLFGAFNLKDLLPTGTASDKAPKMLVHREANSIVTDLDWRTPVEKLDLDLVAFVPDVGHGGSTLVVKATITKPLDGSAGTTVLTGDLDHFDIVFLQSLVVKFRGFHFVSRTGSKTNVDVQLDDNTPVQFVGDLAFVEGLRQIIPPGVFGDGVSIDLIQSPLGVKAGLEIALPPATVGVFALKNIAFSAGLTIPFLDGKPIVEFGFARRDKQFLLAVLIFGGGGFFRVELDTDGMRMLEAAFEFGATAALDIGVASGEVHIMAGIYFKMQKRQINGAGPEKLIASLTGYLRCGGSLCVLGIVKISVEFCLSFTYYPQLDKAKGRATLTVEVSVACFSKSVELTVERAFGGGSADPTFADMIETPALWAEYADAFA